MSEYGPRSTGLRNRDPTTRRNDPGRHPGQVSFSTWSRPGILPIVDRRRSTEPSSRPSSMRILRTLLLCTLISCCGLPASTPAASGHDYLFYEGRTYGSESLIHPLRMILHGGYGILQLDNQDASPWDIDYENGVEVVGRS